ncbi:hypothetical protein J2TS4_33190 [Paenibacillus sp. J2TS4]|nr:hypothetical protein J2TS4_33190 [Paenibacillus sp. J2TS4]
MQASAQVEPASGPINLAHGLIPEVLKPDANIMYQMNIPDYGSPSSELYKLTDEIPANVNDWGDSSWFKFYRDSKRELIFELEQLSTINELSIGFGQRSDVGIAPPLNVRYYASSDGDNYVFLGKAEADAPLYFENVKPGPDHKDIHLKKYRLDKVGTEPMNIQARFIKISFVVDVNCWADEVEISGYKGIVNGAQPPKAQLDPDNPEVNRFPAPGSKEAAYMSDQFLFPTGAYKDPEITNWTKEKVLSVLGYQDLKGNYTDWLFDDILFTTVAAIITPSGFDSNGFGIFATEADYNSYLDFVFQEETQLGAINKAAGELNALLGTDKKVRINFAIPKLTASSDFGDIYGDGRKVSLKPEDFADQVSDSDSEAGKMEMARLALENKKAAIRWYIDEVEKRFAEAGYNNLTLNSYYWVPEKIFDTGDFEVIRGTANYLKSKNYFFTWVPYLQSQSPYLWRELGFTAASIQPNYAFNLYKKGVLSATADIARKVGASVEVEYNDYHTLAQYLNYGIAEGHMKDTFNVYYLATTPIVDGANAYLPLHPNKAADGTSMIKRTVYDRIYEYVKDSYVRRFTMTLATDLSQPDRLSVVPKITLADHFTEGHFTVLYDSDKVDFQSYELPPSLVGKAQVTVTATTPGEVKVTFKVNQSEDALYSDLAQKQDPVSSAVEMTKLYFSAKEGVPAEEIKHRNFIIAREGTMTDINGEVYLNWGESDILPGSLEEQIVQAAEAVRNAEASLTLKAAVDAVEKIGRLPEGGNKSRLNERLWKVKGQIGISPVSQLLDGYEVSGDIREPLLHKLRNRIEQAEHHDSKGHGPQAVKQLNDFVKHLNMNSNLKQVSSDAKDILNAEVQRLIQLWSGLTP